MFEVGDWPSCLVGVGEEDDDYDEGGEALAIGLVFNQNIDITEKKSNYLGLSSFDMNLLSSNVEPLPLFFFFVNSWN